MPNGKQYKQFVAQFNVSEWKLLCQHRLFLHFLKTDLKMAACIAADALDRAVNYLFPRETSPRKPRPSTRKSQRLASSWLPRRRRFRF